MDYDHRNAKLGKPRSNNIKGKRGETGSNESGNSNFGVGLRADHAMNRRRPSRSRSELAQGLRRRHPSPVEVVSREASEAGERLMEDLNRLNRMGGGRRRRKGDHQKGTNRAESNRKRRNQRRWSKGGKTERKLARSQRMRRSEQDEEKEGALEATTEDKKAGGETTEADVGEGKTSKKNRKPRRNNRKRNSRRNKNKKRRDRKSRHQTKRLLKSLRTNHSSRRRNNNRSNSTSFRRRKNSNRRRVGRSRLPPPAASSLPAPAPSTAAMPRDADLAVRPVRIRRRRSEGIKRRKLVFLEESPNYCKEDHDGEKILNHLKAFHIALTLVASLLQERPLFWDASASSSLRTRTAPPHWRPARGSARSAGSRWRRRCRRCSPPVTAGSSGAAR